MSTHLPHPIYVRDIDPLDTARQVHARRSLTGREIRLARGAYVPATELRELNDDDRYRLKVLAVAQTRRHEMVVSHWSAAVLHGLPVARSWPTGVHVSIGRVSGGRSRRDVVKHAIPVSDDEIIEIDGVLVTSIARTVLDLAVSADRESAVIATDRALLIDRFGRVPALVTLDQLWDSYVARGNFRGSARARAVLEFGETGAESPLESLSRLSMRTIGCPAPELQRGFTDYAGAIGNVDFYWERFRLVGEADGAIKYLDPRMRGGKSAAEVVVAEKRREDRIRAIGEGVTRWPWEIGVRPHALRTHLQRAGLPIP